MYKRVLLCYDGTMSNKHALREAADLIVHLGAEAHVLAIVPATSAGDTAATISGGRTTTQEEHHSRRADEVATHLRGRGVESFSYVSIGTPIQHIPAFAKRLTCDLIIVSHKSRGSLGRWWAGGENVALADRAPCSILIAVQQPD